MISHDISWREAPTRLGFNSRAVAMLDRMALKIKARREAREIRSTARMLSTLSDHTLRDIGLIRGSIESRLREHSVFNRDH